MADAGTGPVTAPRADGYEPYDACSDATIAGWVKLDSSGPADMATGEAHGDWPDGPGPWRQT